MTKKPLLDNDEELLTAGMDHISRTHSRLIKTAFIVSAFLAVPGIISSLYRAKDFGFKPLMVLHAAGAAAVLATLVFGKRISVRIRAGVFLAMLFAMGIGGLLTWGLVGMGLFFFIMTGLLATTLFGVRAGLSAVAAGMVVIAVIGTGVCQGWIEFSFDIAAYAKTPSSWIVAFVATGIFTTVLVFSLGRSHAMLSESLDTLAQKTDQFREVNEKLNVEIAARRLAEQTANQNADRLSVLLETIPHAVYECDKTGVITMTNSAYSRITGYDNDEIPGMNIWDLMEPGRQKDELPGYLNYLIEEQPEPVPYITRNQRKDGVTIDIQVDWTYKYDDSGEVVGFVCILSDISKTKTAQRERETLLKTLAAKNSELQSILYVASHDLRSPLVNIHGFSGELSKDCVKIRRLIENTDMDTDTKTQILSTLADDIPESVRFIKTGTRKIDMLINGLLQVSRIGNASMNIVPIDMNTLMKDVIGNFGYRIKEDQVSVSCDSLPPCLGDSAKINQVFSNLIDNALKYLNPNRRGAVRVSGNIENGDCVYCVKDNGIGIAAEHQSKIFEIFHRLDPNHIAKGEGLGLTIVRRIVDRHEGQAWVESEPDLGSEFYILLPHA